MKRGPDVYSYMFTVFGVGSILNLTLVTLLQPHIHFQGMFIIGGFFILCALVTNILMDTNPYAYSSYTNSKKSIISEVEIEDMEVITEVSLKRK